jgi:ectoine hydroxylase-related dioxygenase (phytanoyl-CoA dioxygenase family)
MKLSPEELSSGRLNPETLNAAIEQIRLHGYTYFENVLAPDFVDKLNESFLNVFNAQLDESPEGTEVNTSEFRKNRTRMFLPFEGAFVDPQVLTNPIILQIVEQVLGEDCVVPYMAVDAPLPGSDYQVVHSDAPPFYPEAPVTLPPAGLIMNIPLIDVTEENGPMEIWPGGTHLMPESLNRGNHIRDVSQLSTPHRVLLPKGSLLLRDPRMWHRGTPNKSTQIRPIIALLYARSWWRGHYQDTLAIRRDVHDSLSDRAQQLVRFEELVEPNAEPVQIRIPGYRLASTPTSVYKETAPSK